MLEIYYQFIISIKYQLNTLIIINLIKINPKPFIFLFCASFLQRFNTFKNSMDLSYVQEKIRTRHRSQVRYWEEAESRFKNIRFLIYFNHFSTKVHRLQHCSQREEYSECEELVRDLLQNSRYLQLELVREKVLESGMVRVLIRLLNKECTKRTKHLVLRSLIVFSIYEEFQEMVRDACGNAFLKGQELHLGCTLAIFANMLSSTNSSIRTEVMMILNTQIADLTKALISTASSCGIAPCLRFCTVYRTLLKQTNHQTSTTTNFFLFMDDFFRSYFMTPTTTSTQNKQILQYLCASDDSRIQMTDDNYRFIFHLSKSTGYFSECCRLLARYSREEAWFDLVITNAKNLLLRLHEIKQRQTVSDCLRLVINAMRNSEDFYQSAQFILVAILTNERLLEFFRSSRAFEVEIAEFIWSVWDYRKRGRSSKERYLLELMEGFSCKGMDEEVQAVLGAVYEACEDVVKGRQLEKKNVGWI